MYSPEISRRMSLQSIPEEEIDIGFTGGGRLRTRGRRGGKTAFCIIISVIYLSHATLNNLPFQYVTMAFLLIMASFVLLHFFGCKNFQSRSSLDKLGFHSDVNV